MQIGRDKEREEERRANGRRGKYPRAKGKHSRNTQCGPTRARRRPDSESLEVERWPVNVSQSLVVISDPRRQPFQVASRGLWCLKPQSRKHSAHESQVGPSPLQKPGTATELGPLANHAAAYRESK